MAPGKGRRIAPLPVVEDTVEPNCNGCGRSLGKRDPPAANCQLPGGCGDELPAVLDAGDSDKPLTGEGSGDRGLSGRSTSMWLKLSSALIGEPGGVSSGRM